MKIQFILLGLCICLATKLQAQLQKADYPQWQHPIIQEYRKESKNIVPFYNKDSNAFITLCLLDRKQKTIYWFDCFGYYFDAVPISDDNTNSLKNKAITAFAYYDLITTAYLKTIIKARANLQQNGINALFTKYENELLQINDSSKYPSTLKKLIELDKQKLSIERQIREFNSKSPRLIKEDTAVSKTLAVQYGSMETTYKNADSTITYYNRIALAPAYKAVLQYGNANIKYFNRANQIIDSLQIDVDKITLLKNEKTDVFLLYRGWLEINRYNIVNGINDVRLAIKNVANQKQKITKVQFANANTSLQTALAYTQQLLKLVDYKINYVTTIDRSFVTQCLKQQYKSTKNMLNANEAYLSTFTRGNKFYELTDVRGNVMAVVTDKKIAHSSNGTTIDYYEADIASATDYAPFGSPLPGRNVQSDKYRYGYNGKENDNEVKGQGNQQDYGFRIYDPRLGRFLSVDPLTKEYPWYTPYQFAGNNPVANIDMDGLEPVPADPNYGRNLIFGNEKVVQTVMPRTRDKNNENWLAYKASTLDDVVLQVSNFKNNGASIKNVYIQAHGSSAGLACVNKAIGPTNMSSPTEMNGAENLNSGDVNYYNELQNKLKSGDASVIAEAKSDLADGFDKNKLKAIINLKSIADNMEVGGNLILAGCLTASGDSGTDFLKSISELVGNRVNVLASQDFVVDVTVRTTSKNVNGKTITSKENIFLDKGRSGKWYNKGWKESSKQGVNNTQKDIKLNKKGTPVTSTSTK